MTLILLTLVVVVAFFALTKLLDGNIGSVSLTIGDQQYTLDLIEFGLSAIVLFALGYLFFRFLGYIFKAPKKVGEWSENRTAKRVGSETQKGYADLICGDYSNAEQKLIRNVDKSATPFLNFIAAAHAAHLQGDADKRDKYFNLAYQSDPSSKTAVDISHAQMLYESGELDEAQEALRKALQFAPKNEQLQRMFLEVNRELENWDGVIRQLPSLKKRGKVDKLELDMYSFEAATGLLDSIETSEELSATWKKLSRAQRKDSDYKRVYAAKLVDFEKPYECELFIKKSLRQEWDSELVYLFGLLENDPNRQIKIAKGWFNNHQDDANLLLTLGRLSLRLEDKESAKEYFEKAISAGANEEADRELAKLMEEEGDLQKALEYYRSGMEKLLPATMAEQAKADKEKITKDEIHAASEELKNNEDVIVMDDNDTEDNDENDDSDESSDISDDDNKDKKSTNEGSKLG